MKFATQISPLLNYYNPGAANLFHKEEKIWLKSGKKVGSGKTTVMFKIYFFAVVYCKYDIRGIVVILEVTVHVCSSL